MLGELELFPTRLSPQLFTMALPDSLVPKFLLNEQCLLFSNETLPHPSSALRVRFCRVGK